MEDGFSYVYTFTKPLDKTYFNVYFYWRYFDGSTGESYDVYMPSINCSTQHYSSQILQRLQNYSLSSGLICPDISVLTTQIKMVGDSEGSIRSQLTSQVLRCFS